MAVSLKHKFTSAKTDGGDSTFVQPSNWNDEHDLELGTGKLLGRTTAGTGAAEEITPSADLSLAALSLGLSFTVTAFAKTLLDDADAAAARTTLGLAGISAAGINGVDIGQTTPGLGTFTAVFGSQARITNSTDAFLDFKRTGDANTHEVTRFSRENNNFVIKTRTSDSDFVSTDYSMAIGASGATRHTWRVQDTERFAIDSGGVNVNGTLDVSGTSTLGIIRQSLGGWNEMVSIWPEDANQDLGTSNALFGNRWRQIFLQNAPNVSSDARLKDEIADLTEAERRAAAKIKTRTYRWKEGGQKKVGYIAQEVIEAMASENLCAFEYGLVTDGETYGVDMDAINAFRLG